MLMKLPTKKSKIVKDLNKYTYLIYGEPKVGKTTFCSKFGKTLFICTEPGHKFVEVYGGDQTHKTWEEIKDTARRFLTEEHDFQTLCIDTVDNAFDFCRAYVNKSLGIKHESEDKNYGRSWAQVAEEFQKLKGALANRGFGLIFISHATTEEKTVSNITRNVVTCTLPKKPKKFISGLCDFILYCYEDNDGNKLMRSKGDLNTTAGDRSGSLPDPMRMSYKEFKHILEETDWDKKRDIGD